MDQYLTVTIDVKKFFCAIDNRCVSNIRMLIFVFEYFHNERMFKYTDICPTATRKQAWVQVLFKVLKYITST